MINIKQMLIDTILNCKNINSTYLYPSPNSKFNLQFIVDELLCFFKSGSSWRHFRSSINFRTLHWHFSRFADNNIFLRLFNKIVNLYSKYIVPSTLLIDSTSIPNKFGITKIGRNKFYKNKFITKISLLTDINGFPLSVFFLKGNFHDNATFKKHINDAIIMLPKKKFKIIADKAYSSQSNYSLLDSNNIEHIIPPRKNMNIYKTYKYAKNEYAKRIKIENTFAHLKAFRRFNYRYDKFMTSFRAFTYLAFSIIASNILNKF